MHVQCNIETRSCNLCCSEKTISITYSEHVFVALGMQWACTILSSVACPAVQYFSTLPHKRHDFRKKKKTIEHQMCVLLLPSTFVWNISHSKKNWARYDQKCIFSLRKVPVILVRFNEIKRSRQIFKKKILKYQISYKSVQWEPSCFMRTDRRPDAQTRRI